MHTTLMKRQRSARLSLSRTSIVGRGLRVTAATMAVPAGIGAGIAVSVAAPGTASADPGLSLCQSFNGVGPPGVYIETGYIPFAAAMSCPAGSSDEITTQSALYKEDTSNDTWTNIDPGAGGGPNANGELWEISDGTPISVQSTWQCSASSGYCYPDEYKQTYSNVAWATPDEVAISLPGCPATDGAYITCAGSNYIDWTSATTYSIYGNLD